MTPRNFPLELFDYLFEGVYLVDLERRITYWNKSAEMITGYTREEVVGRQCMDNILVHIDKRGRNLCRGSCPLVKAMTERITEEAEVFLHHKNGHRIPIRVRVMPVKDAAGNVVGGIEVFHDARSKIAKAEELDSLRKLALLDQLTELPNRRYAELTVSSLLAEIKHIGGTFGLLMADIDLFKNINDTHGHIIGDKTLRMVAQTLQSNLRSRDMVARWGGEEFIGILRSVDESRLFEATDRLRMLVEKSVLFEGSQEIRATISVGATMAWPDDDPEKIIRRADELLYQSKESGRNRVTTSPGL